MTGAAVSTVSLTTTDGHTLGAAVRLADESLGGVVLCHPHPLYGGSRHDAVVGAVWDATLAAGFSAIRFDFRRAHDKGDAERIDVVAAIDALAPRRVVLVGYSFGSYVCLRTDDAAVLGWVGIAPIVDADDHAAGRDERPTLLVTARHDQYAPPAQVAERTAAWRNVRSHELPSADHFLAGHHAQVAGLAVGFVRELLAPG